MNIQKTLMIFDALSQETRLKAFRMLIKAGPQGLAAGKLSQEIGIAHNTMSFHLSHLCNAGIVSSKKEGRFMIYHADFEVFSQVIAFMVMDCCHPDYATTYDDENKECSIIELKNLYLAEKEG